MLVTFTVTAVISTICTLVQGIPDTLTTGMVAGLLYNGIFVNAIGYTCWMLALEYGKTAVISNLAYLTPFISLVMAGIVLKEPVSGSSIAGLLLIIGGIVIQMAAEENEKSCSTSRVNES
jgi:drug/metabolite transporter (DMT)-like permease